MERWTYEPAYVAFRSALDRCTRTGLIEWKAANPDSFVERCGIWEQLAVAEVLTGYSPRVVPRTRSGKLMTEG